MVKINIIGRLGHMSLRNFTRRMIATSMNVNKYSLRSESFSSSSRSNGNDKNEAPLEDLQAKIAQLDKSLMDPDSEDSIFDRDFVEIKVEDYEELYKNDETGQIKEQIEIALKDYEYYKYNSMGKVPSFIEPVDMSRMLCEAPTPNLREKFIHYLYKREMTKRSAAIKKEREKIEKLAERTAKIQEMERKYGKVRSGLLAPNGSIIYGLWHNTLFSRVPEGKLKGGYSTEKLRQAALFGRKIVFDFAFDEHMQPWICRNVMDQIQEAYGLNRFRYDEPFDLWFCNFKRDSAGSKYLTERAIRNLDDGSMITVKEDCFTNHFDKSRLVYLSPNAKERVDSNFVSSDDVYIIGAYNDKGSAKPLTYSKAQSLGIRAKSLPLDDYIAWQGGSKSLCVNHVVGILLEVMSNGGDWRNAMLKHIPQRKVKPIEVLVEEEERRLSKMRRKNIKKKFSIRDDFDI